MLFTNVNLGGVEGRFYFDNKSKNLANFDSIIFQRICYTTICLELGECFRFKTRVRALQTTIKYFNYHLFGVERIF